jgi:hypothetical protein
MARKLIVSNISLSIAQSMEIVLNIMPGTNE